MNWKALTKTAKRTLSRNSSKILLGLGIAGAFTAVGFAITATPKAMILLEEKKQELGVEKLDAKTIVKTAAPVYIPTAISMGVSTGCIIAASSVNDRRNAALAAAYTMSETALRSYQDKVVETVGPEKAKEIKEAVALDKMAKCPEPDEIPTAKNLAPDDVSYDKKVSIENTRFIFTTNFSGDPSRDRFGSNKRRVNLVLTEDMAHHLMDMGVTVKQTRPNPEKTYDEPFLPTYFVPVNVNMESKWPPHVYWVTTTGKKLLCDIDMVGQLDYIRVKNVNCLCNLVEKHNNPGEFSLYADVMYVEQDADSDPYAERYARFAAPEADMAEPSDPTEIPF